MSAAFDFAKARENMVEQQVRPWDVLDIRVLDVLARMPREAFVADPHKALAYADLELPLAHGERMFKPVLEGRILQALKLQPGEDVLEIGSGSGYLSACMAALAGNVLALERHADLAEAARRVLQAQGAERVRIETVDALAWQGERRFDAICVGAAVTTIPEVFTRWLKPGGRLFAVRGHAPALEAVLLHADDNALRAESLFETDLPYLVGAAPAPAFQL